MVDLSSIKVLDGEIEASCITCKQSFKLAVSESELNRWQQGELIQSVMPHLTEDQRELLISGLCGKCFNKLFEN